MSQMPTALMGMESLVDVKLASWPRHPVTGVPNCSNSSYCSASISSSDWIQRPTKSYVLSKFQTVLQELEHNWRWESHICFLFSLLVNSIRDEGVFSDYNSFRNYLASYSWKMDLIATMLTVVWIFCHGRQWLCKGDCRNRGWREFPLLLCLGCAWRQLFSSIFTSKPSELTPAMIPSSSFYSIGESNSSDHCLVLFSIAKSEGQQSLLKYGLK